MKRKRIRDITIVTERKKNDHLLIENVCICFAAINRCDPNPCRNGATCQQSGNDKFVCLCPPSFKGTLCTGICL